MTKRIVFAFHQKEYGGPRHLDVLFHKRGIFSRSRANYDQYHCPVDDINWADPLFHSRFQHMPSILMRFIMHPSIVAQYAPQGHVVIVTTHYSEVRDSIVIVHKSLVTTPGALAVLKKNNNILIFDVLDFADGNILKYINVFDGIIICSVKGYAFYANLDWIKIPIFYITHCVDTRLPERTTDLDHFSPLFHGAPENVLWYPSLLKIVPLALCYPQYTSMEEWLETTLRANFFYAVRPPLAPLRSKPFQKGFTASRLNSNILIHKDDGDALHYLGEDYPYLIHEEPTEEILWRYMLQARDDFGGPRWNQGLAIMRDLKDAFSNETIAAQF